MPWFSGQPYTGFRGVNLKGSTYIRLEGGGATAGTLTFDSSENISRAWRFPNKSGTFPVSGTFTVGLPAIAASSYGETAVTVSGIRREDALVVTIQNLGGTTVTATNRTYPFIAGARAENGYTYLTFYNPSTTATTAAEIVLAYAAVR